MLTMENMKKTQEQNTMKIYYSSKKQLVLFMF